MQYSIFNIIDSVDKNWDKDLIIRYLLVNLAPFFRRDLNFFLRSDEEKIDMLKKKIKYQNDGIVICRTICEFYTDLFKSFDINTVIIKATDKYVPLYSLVVEGTYSLYYLDPLQDLMYSQYGINNYNYGLTPNWKNCVVKEQYPQIKSLSNEYVNYLDKRINRFINIIKMDDVLQSIRKDILDRTNVMQYFNLNKWDDYEVINAKLNLISKFFINNGQVNGLIERYQMYNFIKGLLFEKKLKPKIKINIYRDYDEFNNPINPRLNINILDDDKNVCANYVETQIDNKYTLKRIK